MEQMFFTSERNRVKDEEVLVILECKEGTIRQGMVSKGENCWKMGGLKHQD